jgi:hypothetical protein
MSVHSYIDLEVGGLTGQVFYSIVTNSYVVVVYQDDTKLTTRIFGNGVDAENCLLDLLEHPAWTILKHG